MTGLYIFIGSFLILMFILMLSRIKVHVEYHRDQQDDRFFIHIALLGGLLKFKTEFTGIDLKHKLENLSVKVNSEVETEVGSTEAGVDMQGQLAISRRNLNMVYQMLGDVVHYLKIHKQVIMDLIRLTRVKELNWATTFGLGDAAATGITAGFVWSIKSLLLQALFRINRSSFSTTKVKVQPDFSEKNFKVNLRCIFDVKTGHIIIAGCKMFIIRIKLWFLRLQRGSDG